MDEILKRDQNHVTVLGGITNDSDQDIVMLRVDPITKRLLVAASGGGGGNNFSINEVPTGTIDDSTVTFTLANTPIAGTVAVYVNRLRLILTTDYSISGDTITLINPVGTGGAIICDYQY